MHMNISRNQTVMIAVAVLVIVLLAAFGAAKMADSKEQSAAEAINDMYNEAFIPVKSTVSTFGNEFKITVQSEQTKNVYDFDVNGDDITGTYYNENVNIELAQIIETATKGLALVNAKMPDLTEATALNEVDIEEIDAMLISPKGIDDSTAEQIAKFLQEAVGNIPITLDVLVVENETDYSGVTFEIQNYFQLSSVTKDSFTSLKYEEQHFEFK